MTIKHYFCPSRALASAGAHNARMPQHAVRTEFMKGTAHKVDRDREHTKKYTKQQFIN